MSTTAAASRQTQRPNQWFEGRQLLGVVLHSSDELNNSHNEFVMMTAQKTLSGLYLECSGRGV